MGSVLFYSSSLFFAPRMRFACSIIIERRSAATALPVEQGPFFFFQTPGSPIRFHLFILITMIITLERERERKKSQSLVSVSIFPFISHQTSTICLRHFSRTLLVGYQQQVHHLFLAQPRGNFQDSDVLSYSLTTIIPANEMRATVLDHSLRNDGVYIWPTMTSHYYTIQFPSSFFFILLCRTLPHFSKGSGLNR